MPDRQIRPVPVLLLTGPVGVGKSTVAAEASRLLREARSLLRHIEHAVPGADVTVIRLRAPLPVLHARIRAREAGRDPQWYLDAATFLSDEMDRSPVEDYLLESAPLASVRDDGRKRDHSSSSPVPTSALA